MMMRRIAWACLGLIVAVAFVVFLVWAILHPHGPRFVLQDVTINDFNVSQPNFLSSNLQVTVSSRNPNDKIGIFYDRLDIYVTYRNQEVAFCVLMQFSFVLFGAMCMDQQILVCCNVKPTKYHPSLPMSTNI